MLFLKNNILFLYSANKNPNKIASNRKKVPVLKKFPSKNPWIKNLDTNKEMNIIKIYFI